MFGNLTDIEIEEVISSQVVGRIGCHADNTTYVVPVSYAYDGIYVYGHTPEGMKVAMMRKNPKICFQTDRMDDMANWKSVIAWGDFEEVVDPEERKDVVQKLFQRNLPLISSETAHLSPQWPFGSPEDSDVTGVIYRVRLEEKTGRYEKAINKTYFAS